MSNDELESFKALTDILRNKNKALDKENNKNLQKIQQLSVELSRQKEIFEEKTKINKFNDILGVKFENKSIAVLKLTKQFVLDENVDGLNFLNDNFYCEMFEFNADEIETNNLDILYVFMDRKKQFLKYLHKFIIFSENTQVRNIQTGLLELGEKAIFYFKGILNSINISILTEFVTKNRTEVLCIKFKNIVEKMLKMHLEKLEPFLINLSASNTIHMIEFMSLEIFMRIQTNNNRSEIVKNILKHKNKNYITHKNINLFTEEQIAMHLN